jgi:outer membrane receptor protein involved in Fe transport
VTLLSIQRGPVALDRWAGAALLLFMACSPGWAQTGSDTPGILSGVDVVGAGQILPGVTPVRPPPAPGYSLFDLRTAHQWRNLRLDFVITNLLDRQYASPLGGTWQSARYPPGFTGAAFRPLPAAGRSFDTAFSVIF